MAGYNGPATVFSDKPYIDIGHRATTSDPRIFSGMQAPAGTGPTGEDGNLSKTVSWLYKLQTWLFQKEEIASLTATKQRGYTPSIQLPESGNVHPLIFQATPDILDAMRAGYALRYKTHFELPDATIRIQPRTPFLGISNGFLSAGGERVDYPSVATTNAFTGGSAQYIPHALDPTTLRPL
jgi:hypothetical protein